MQDRRPYGDAVVTGYGTIFGRKVFVFSQDFTVFGGSPVGGVRREDLQGHGPGAQVRLPRDRHQRLGRRAHPGRRRLARRLRRDLLAQRPGLRRDPADLADHGPLRRRRRLLAGDDRLHPHGRGLVVHVHHRPRRREDGDRRGGDVRGARRRSHARVEVRRRAPRRAGRGGLPRRRPLPALVPAAVEPRAAAAATEPADPVERESPELDTLDPGQPEQALRHEAGDHARSSTTATSSSSSRSTRRTSCAGFARLGGQPVGHRRQPAALARRRARHRLLDEGGAVRPHVRRVQHPARHVRRRAGLPAGHVAGVGRASSATAPSCSTPTRRRRCRSSP